MVYLKPVAVRVIAALALLKTSRTSRALRVLRVPVACRATPLPEAYLVTYLTLNLCGEVRPREKGR